jgi:LysR family transcriptional regulator, nitrogen assimilation regulatory protein
MKFTDLKIFVEVVEAGGMTQAAAKRGVSQPGLSRTIREIESRLQARLLKRTGRGVELTPAGTEFLAFARATLDAYRGAKDKIQALSGAMPSQLTLAIPLRLGRLIIPELIQQFSLSMPDVTLRIFEEATARVTERLAAGEYDLAISYVQPNTNAPGRNVNFTESLYLVGTEAFLDHLGAEVPMAEASKLPLLLPSAPHYRGLIDDAFQRAGFSANVARELEVSEAMLAYASEGEGVTILPYSNFYLEADRGEIMHSLIVNPKIERKIFISSKPALDRHIANSAISILKSCLKSQQIQAKWKFSTT